MSPSPPAVATAFDAFLELWPSVEARVYERVDGLDKDGRAQGTVEDFASLLRAVDDALQSILLGLEPPAACVPRACVFVRLWPEPDDLADQILSLSSSYVSAIERLRAESSDSPHRGMAGVP